MNQYATRYRRRICAAAVLLAAATFAHAQQQHAHTHGRLVLDAAIDAQSITLRLESPLANFLGFERPPRTDEERRRVADMTARLNAADRLFQPDPAAACKLSQVDLDSAALDLGDGGKAGGHAHEKDHVHDEGDAREKGHAHEEAVHADIDVTIVFACARAPQARFIDVGLFGAFEGVRVIDAQVASAQGQFKRTLRPGSPRLSWGR